MNDPVMDDSMADDQLAPARISRYMVSKNFSQRVNGVTIPWKAGDVVDREDLVRDLLAVGAPIAEISDEDDVGTCPHCGKSFSIQAQRGARELLARAKMLMPGFR